MPNVCMVGHGAMGAWHPEPLNGAGARRHTVVGRKPDPDAGPATPRSGLVPDTTAKFADRYGTRTRATSLDEALADPEIDIVIIAGPSETPADTGCRRPGTPSTASRSFPAGPSSDTAAVV
jgi:2-hydroxy-4-carboxymuconate semialdehyde hemiacetal dehydrogenase